MREGPSGRGGAGPQAVRGQCSRALLPPRRPLCTMHVPLQARPLGPPLLTFPEPTLVNLEISDSFW